MDHLTARVSCFARAFHFKNSRTPVFADRLAENMLGEDYKGISESMTQGISFFLPGFQGTPEEGLRLIADRQLSPSVLARSAFCESRLEAEKGNGCGQYVLFAAGYDTFAARQHDSTLSVFELDLPEMLADKEKRLKEASLESCAVPVPCDLSGNEWTGALCSAGFDRKKKAFAGLLGISYYLEKSDWEKLLKRTAALFAEGSAICFDYPSADESKVTKTNKLLAGGAGEAMKALYTPAEMEELVDQCGFTVSEHLDSVEMTRLFFSAHNASDPGHSMSAPQGVRYILAFRKA